MECGRLNGSNLLLFWIQRVCSAAVNRVRYAYFSPLISVFQYKKCIGLQTDKMMKVLHLNLLSHNMLSWSCWLAVENIPNCKTDAAFLYSSPMDYILKECTVQSCFKYTYYTLLPQQRMFRFSPKVKAGKFNLGCKMVLLNSQFIKLIFYFVLQGAGRTRTVILKDSLWNYY